MAEEEQSEEQEGGGGKKKVILLVVIGLLLVGLSVGGTIAVLALFKEDPSPEEVVEGESEESEQAEEVKAAAVYFPINPAILLTYTDRGRQRYAQIEITLMTRSDKVVAEVELHSSRIRNDLIMAFSGMEYAEIQTSEGKELMRQQALMVVQEVLTQEMNEPGVEQVLFTNLVMQ